MNEIPCLTESDELLWLAVRYLEHDLPEADRLRFEDRLATDVEACSAVAEAVQLAAGVRAALAPPPHTALPEAPHANRLAKQKLWVPVALSAALLMITLGLMTARQQPAEENVEVATAELLSRWRQDHDVGFSDEFDQEDDGTHESEIMDESLSAPGWLISAVRLTAKSDEQRP